MLTIEFAGRAVPQVPQLVAGRNPSRKYNFAASVAFCVMGYWHQRADEKHGNPPKGKWELLVVKDKVSKNPR